MINQSQILYQFNEQNREKFNEDFFVRNTQDIVEEFKKVVLSCQREQYFTLKVAGFEVIEDYEKIMTLMAKQQEATLKNRRKKKINQYEYVNLKDTDVILIITKYYIQVKDEFEYLDVYTLIPIYVDKYYFRIYGNLYSAIHQIVDGSTYNNSTSSSKKQNITLKILFTPIRIYRNNYSIVNDEGEEIKAVTYSSFVFKKSFNIFKYIFAKYGLVLGLQFFGVNYVAIYNKKPEKAKELGLHVFECNDVYVTVPKEIYNLDNTTQCIIYCIMNELARGTTYEDMFIRHTWLASLGSEFGSATIEKGNDILKSLENLYDIPTKENIHLPEEEKKDIYHILRWMIREFINLRLKNNLDISTKRVRCPEYIASLYAMKLVQGIYRLSDQKARVTLESIRKVLLINPNYLIDAICKCNLVNYRNLSNDLDAITALKYTFKGISGLGQKGNKSVPEVYKTIDVSQVGILDLDSSPKSDPGMSGIFCPLAKTYDGSFSEYEEPLTWEGNFNNLVNNYKKMQGLKEVIKFKKDVLNQDINLDEEGFIDSCINDTKKLMRPIKFVEDTAIIEPLEFPLEDGNMIVYQP